MRAHSVEFKEFSFPADDHAPFSSKEVWFDFTYYYDGHRREKLFPIVNIRDLLQPSKWVDGHLPAILVIVSSVPAYVNETIEDIKKIASLVPSGTMTVYSANEHLYASCGVPVVDIGLLKR